MDFLVEEPIKSLIEIQQKQYLLLKEIAEKVELITNTGNHRGL